MSQDLRNRFQCSSKLYKPIYNIHYHHLMQYTMLFAKIQYPYRLPVDSYYKRVWIYVGITVFVLGMVFVFGHVHILGLVL
jgi:hypothetical protein